MRLQIFTDILKIKSVIIRFYVVYCQYLQVTPEEPVLAGVTLWYVQLCWISIEGGWNALWNNAPGSREQRMKGSLV